MEDVRWKMADGEQFEVLNLKFSIFLNFKHKTTFLPHPKQSLRPQLFSEADDIHELTLLLNTAYKKWQDTGFNYLAARQTADMTRKRIKHAKCFVLKDKDRIIATITYSPPLSKTSSEHPLYLQPGVATYGQLAVHPDFQKKGIASALIRFVEQLAVDDKAQRLIIDTAENNTILLNYYFNKGYEIIERTNWSSTNYTSVFLCKTLIPVSEKP